MRSPLVRAPSIPPRTEPQGPDRITSPSDSPLLVLAFSDGSEGAVGPGCIAAVADALNRRFPVMVCDDLNAARSGLRVRNPFAVLLIAEECPAVVCEALDVIEELAPDCRVVIATARKVIDDGVIAPYVRRHTVHDVMDFNQATFDELVQTLAGLQRLRAWSERPSAVTHTLTRGFGRLVGESIAMESVAMDVRRLARTDLPILITGESGTGKEVTAQAIHELSSLNRGPFVPINCAALPASLIGSELFGYERGAFTGAAQRKPGQFELAEGGTLFLDEVGDMPLEIQTHLLRFLQEGTIVRLGGTKSIRINTRVICATHVDLEKAIEKGTFREDLYYRLNVLLLDLPPLREREEDVQLLADHYLQTLCDKHDRHGLRFSREARSAMQSYRWPGNVRELMSAVARAVIMCRGQVIKSSDLGIPNPVEGARPLPTLAEARAETDIGLMQKAYSLSGHNVKQAAEFLGISRVAFYRLLKKHELTLP